MTSVFVSIRFRSVRDPRFGLIWFKKHSSPELPLDDFKLSTIPPDPLADFLTEHGFTSLLKRLDGGRGSPERKTQLHPAKPVTAGAAASTDGTRQPLPDMPAVDRSAYACVKEEPERYARMSASAIERMRGHCSLDVASERLRAFLNPDEAPSR